MKQILYNEWQGETRDWGWQRPKKGKGTKKEKVATALHHGGVLREWKSQKTGGARVHILVCTKLCTSILFPACQGQTDPQPPVELGDSRTFGMDRMTGSAHQSGSSLPWRQQWVLPGGLDCLGLALGEFRMFEVPFSYSGSYWEFKVSIRGDRFCGYRSLYAGDTHPRSTATHQMQYSRWAVQAVTMTCRLQGRYAGGRDPCRLGIRPSVDQVESSPDQRGKREKEAKRTLVFWRNLSLSFFGSPFPLLD